MICRSTDGGRVLCGGVVMPGVSVASRREQAPAAASSETTNGRQVA
jgi:hypothetical protein